MNKWGSGPPSEDTTAAVGEGGFKGEAIFNESSANPSMSKATVNAYRKSTSWKKEFKRQGKRGATLIVFNTRAKEKFVQDKVRRIGRLKKKGRTYM